MTWTQTYDPLGHPVVSTLVAALPLVVLLGLLASHRIPAHVAALAGLAAAVLVAVLAVGMPGGLALRAAGFGAAYGLFPIGWIVLNVIFLYQLADGRGSFVVLKGLITSVTGDR
ncbi:MAG: L-lactate permease, partial [Gemmatimonadales bacterium]